MGPPSTASGATWPMQNPWVPPEKRPSVIEGGVAAAAGALHGAGDGEHLAHARAALGALVADDDDVAGLDAAGEDRLHRAVLAVEHPGRALEAVEVDAGDLHHRALRAPASR